MKKKREYRLSDLRSGNTTSCGCVQKELCTRHGMYKTKQYKVWAAIIQRCKNENHKEWQNYGGRGISICDKWLTFEGFWEDMKENYSEGLELDRINVNGNYDKQNCRWTTESENAYNQRKLKNNTSGKTGVCFHKHTQKWHARIDFQGETKNLGLFSTLESAIKAREEAELLYFGYNKE